MQVDPEIENQLDPIAHSPKFWFWIALCALVPVQLWFVINDPWFSQPPKPVGDGPDYENIAWHISRGYGWSTDWTNPQWRAPYLAASVNVASDTPMIDYKRRRAPIADYTTQLSRTDDLSANTGRPPLFPLLNACVYWFVPRGPISFAIVRSGLALCIAISGSLAVAIAVRITSQITRLAWPNVLAAMVTMALAAMDRTMRTYATDFLTEPVALLLVQLMLWCFCEYMTTASKPARPHSSHFVGDKLDRRLVATGVLLGLLILTRSIAVLWLPGIWIVVLLLSRRLHRKRWRAEALDRPIQSSVLEDIRRATLVVGLALLVCTPWWFRNCLVLGAFMPLGTQGPITLVGGYNDEALERKGEWFVGPELQLRESLGQPPSESILEREKRVAQAAGRQVSQWARDHWRRLPILAWVRIKTEWNPYSGRVLLVKLAALTGLCWLLILHRSATLLLGGVLLVNTLTVMVLYSVGGRFLIPTFGIVYTLAGIGMACTLSWRRLAAVD